MDAGAEGGLFSTAGGTGPGAGIVAEDLGYIDEGVGALLKTTDFRG
jgi:4-alpha-glucanotransferase